MRSWLSRMAGSVSRPPVFVVGVDLGLRRIKLVGIAGSGGPEVRWAVDVETPVGIFGSDGQFDSVAAGRVVSQLLGAAPGVGYPAALVLPSTALRIRRLSSVPRDPGALRRSLLADAELRVPGVAAEQLHLAVSASGDTPIGEGGNAAPGAVAAAVRRDAIRAYSVVASQAGLQPHRLTAPALALANLHALLHPEEQDRPVLLLHVGSQRSELVVVHRGGLLLSLSVVLGTQPLFDRLAAAGVDFSDPDLAASLGASAEAQGAVQDWVARLRGSHRTAIGAAERHLGSSLEQLPVRVSGGVARYSAVMAALSQALDSPVDVLDPRPPHLPSGGDWFGPSMVLALGAALEARAMAGQVALPDGEGPVLLNLAVEDDGTSSGAGRAAITSLVRDPMVLAAVVLALALSAGFPALLDARLRNLRVQLERDRAAYQREAQQVAADSARLFALHADSARLAGTLGTLAALEADRYAWPKLMAAVAGSLPGYAWLEGIELEPGQTGQPPKFRLRGVAPTQAEVSRFERNLKPDVGELLLEGSESLMVGPFPLIGFRFAGFLPDSISGDQPQLQGAGYNPASTPVVLADSTP